MSRQATLLQSIQAAPEMSDLLRRRAALDWLTRSWNKMNAMGRREFVPLILSMAADAALDADEPMLRLFLRASFWAETYAAEEGAVRESAQHAAALENSWTMRRYLSQTLSCDCFHSAFAANCSLPGCEKLHTPYGASPQKLLKCSRCKSAYYCSDAHIAQHWPQHKAECRRIAAAAAAGNA